MLTQHLRQCTRAQLHRPLTHRQKRQLSQMLTSCQLSCLLSHRQNSQHSRMPTQQLSHLLRPLLHHLWRQLQSSQPRLMMPHQSTRLRLPQKTQLLLPRTCQQSSQLSMFTSPQPSCQVKRPQSGSMSSLLSSRILPHLSRLQIQMLRCLNSHQLKSHLSTLVSCFMRTLLDWMIVWMSQIRRQVSRSLSCWSTQMQRTQMQR